MSDDEYTLLPSITMAHDDPLDVEPLPVVFQKLLRELGMQGWQIEKRGAEHKLRGPFGSVRVAEPMSPEELNHVCNTLMSHGWVPSYYTKPTRKIIKQRSEILTWMIDNNQELHNGFILPWCCKACGDYVTEIEDKVKVLGPLHERCEEKYEGYMGDEKERRRLIKELTAQNWDVQRIGSGRIRCVPPFVEMGKPVFISHASNDRYGIDHAIRDLKKSGFVPGRMAPVERPVPAPKKSEPLKQQPFKDALKTAPSVPKPANGAVARTQPPVVVPVPPPIEDDTFEDEAPASDPGEVYEVERGMPFSDALTALRRRKRWTKRRLADEVSKHLGYKLSDSSIWRWENDQPPVRKHYDALCVVLPTLKKHQEPEFIRPDMKPPVGERGPTGPREKLSVPLISLQVQHSVRKLTEDQMTALSDLLMSDDVFRSLGEKLQLLFDALHDRHVVYEGFERTQTEEEEQPPVSAPTMTNTTVDMVEILEEMQSLLRNNKNEPFSATFFHQPGEPWAVTLDDEELVNDATGVRPASAARAAVGQLKQKIEKKTRELNESLALYADLIGDVE